MVKQRPSCERFIANRPETMGRQVVAGCVLLALLAIASGKELDYLQAVENPHIRDRKGSTVQEEGQCSAADSCPVSQFVNPANILSGHIDAQPDTLLDIKIFKYMGVQVPIYYFKQPGVASIELSSVVTIPHRMGHDSWFPNYYWEILVCGGCDGWRHIGWKFSPKTGSGEGFYALIVDYGEGRQRQAEASHPEAVLEALTVGVRAPAWLIALATATLHAQINMGSASSGGV